MSEISVRVAGVADAEAVARLMTALNGAVGPAYGLARTPEHITVTVAQARRRIERMAGVEQVLLAEDGATAIGLLSLRIVPYLSEDALYAEAAELFVVPEKRRRGVARERGCTSIHVNARLDNADAQAAYRTAGYDAVEVGFEKRLAAID